MQSKTHYVQDALEKYAVYLLQAEAEKAGRALARRSARLLADFHSYCTERHLFDTSLPSRLEIIYDNNVDATYMTNIEAAAPDFFRRLSAIYKGCSFNFFDIEAEARNRGSKSDFAIVLDNDQSFGVSLKNYKSDPRVLQFSSGTFNSFILNFLLEPARSVGMWIDPTTGTSFKGSSRSRRDRALEAAGYSRILKSMHALDRINVEIKQRFVYSPEFEFLDETQFDQTRKKVGHEALSLVIDILQSVDSQILIRQLISRCGMDGSDELFLIGQRHGEVFAADTITNTAFSNLRTQIQSNTVHLDYSSKGQSLQFVISSQTNEALVTLTVPFTINKNGAWVSGEAYDGVRPYPGRGKDSGTPLAWGQRRPEKSKELATSINSYIEFGTDVFHHVSHEL